MMDGMLGQMEEPVELPPYKESKRSATVIPPTGCAGRQKIDSRSMPRPQSYTETMEDALERARNQLFQENLRWVDEEVKYDEYMMDDAEYVLSLIHICGWFFSHPGRRCPGSGKCRRPHLPAPIPCPQPACRTTGRFP